MHRESEIQIYDYIEIKQGFKVYNVYVYSMNDAVMHVKADLDQLGTSSVPRPVKLICNYSEILRKLVDL